MMNVNAAPAVASGIFCCYYLVILDSNAGVPIPEGIISTERKEIDSVCSP